MYSEVILRITSVLIAMDFSQGRRRKREEGRKGGREGGRNGGREEGRNRETFKDMNPV